MGRRANEQPTSVGLTLAGLLGVLSFIRHLLPLGLYVCMRTDASICYVKMRRPLAYAHNVYSLATASRRRSCLVALALKCYVVGMYPRFQPHRKLLTSLLHTNPYPFCNLKHTYP